MKLRRSHRDRPQSDGGWMAVEIVLLTPVMVAFLLLVIAFGRYVAVRGEVESASRDAVRAASMERSSQAAVAAAQNTAASALNSRWSCQPAQLGGNFAAGETITVHLECSASLSGLGLIGLPGSVSVDGDSSAPLDLYRRTG
jgi:hypothetical protein